MVLARCWAVTWILGMRVVVGEGEWKGHAAT